MSRDVEHAYDVGQEWAEDAAKEREASETCARCPARAEWRDDDTGRVYCGDCTVEVTQ